MRGVAFAFLALVAAPARGHGPAPAALDAVGPVDGRPAAVRTNIGLAVARPEGGYRYVCPSAWGAEDRFPPAVRFDDGRLAVAYAGVLYRSRPDGCGFAGTPLDPEMQSALAFVRGGAGAWLVTRDAAGSSVWRVPAQGAPARVARLPDVTLDSGAVDEAGDLWAASSRPSPALLRYDERGARGHVPLALDVEPHFLGVRAVREGRVFLAAIVAGGVALLESGAALAESTQGERFTEVLRADVALHGPIEHAGAWIALRDGVLAVRESGGGFVEGPAVGWTCLQQAGAVSLACVDRGLAVLSGPAADPAVTPVFSIGDLHGPECDQAEPCAYHWLHYGGEAGLVRLDAGAPEAGAGDGGPPDGAPPDGGPPATDPGGCRAAGDAPALFWPALMLGCAALRRRPG